MDVFTILMVLFCVTQSTFNFIGIKKQEHRGKVQQILYSPMLFFYLIDGVFGSVRGAHFFPVMMAPLSFLMDASFKTFFTQISSCIRFFDSETK